MGDGLQTTFWTMAIAGTALFVLKLVLMFLGLGDHDSGDMDFHGGDLDGGVDLDHGGVALHDHRQRSLHEFWHGEFREREAFRSRRAPMLEGGTMGGNRLEQGVEVLEAWPSGVR